MKAPHYYYCILLLIAVNTISCLSSKRYYQDIKRPIFFEASKGTPFKMAKLKSGSDGGLRDSLSNDFKLAPDHFFFEIATEKRVEGSPNQLITLISFFDYKDTSTNMKRAKRKVSVSMQYHTDSSLSAKYINKKDNGSIFWMDKSDFDYLKSKKFIREYFRRGYPTFTTGANLFVPFKMRPETAGQYMKISPELSLGGYAGIRFQLSNYSPFSITVPVVTLGVTTLGINRNNTIVEAQKTEVADQDALILGRTFAIGAVLEYNNFQFGIIAGWDKAGGELGKHWIYNDRLWYSFSIGFDFLRPNKNE